MRYESYLFERRLEGEIAGFKRKYGLAIDLDPLSIRDHSSITEILTLRPYDAFEGIGIIAEEAAKYPASFLPRYCSSVIRLVWAYSRKDSSYKDGLVYPSGTTYYPKGVIYLAVGYGADELTLAFHHEMYHQAERREMEIFGPLRPFFEWGVNRAWAKINPNGNAVYLKGQYEEPQETIDTPGFDHYYGKREEPEDRATIASSLIAKPKALRERCRVDEVLRRKTAAIMEEFYYRSGRVMDERWFASFIERSEQ